MPTKGDSDNSWTVKVSDIANYDLSAKNPAKQKQEARMGSAELFALIRKDNEKINGLVEEVEGVMRG